MPSCCMSSHVTQHMHQCLNAHASFLSPLPLFSSLPSWLPIAPFHPSFPLSPLPPPLHCPPYTMPSCCMSSHATQNMHERLKLHTFFSPLSLPPFPLLSSPSVPPLHPPFHSPIPSHPSPPTHPSPPFSPPAATVVPDVVTRDGFEAPQNSSPSPFFPSPFLPSSCISCT
ncbi:unnamed protein product [Closterium sp. NIES-54]